MPKDADDRIRSALETYARDPNQNQKKGVLLTPQDGFFLYGNRFCSITGYELELFSESYQVQGKAVTKPLFFSLLPGRFEAVGGNLSGPLLVSLIFQIHLEEDEPLRGILLAVEQEAELSLFSDASTEALYRLSRRVNGRLNPIIPPDEGLRQYGEMLRRNDLHLLTELYLQGRKLKELSHHFPFAL